MCNTLFNDIVQNAYKRQNFVELEFVMTYIFGAGITFTFTWAVPNE